MHLPRLFDKRRRAYEELATRHLDGVLDAGGEARLEELLAADPARAAEVRELEALTSLLHSEPMVEPPRSFALPYTPAPERAAPRLASLRWMQAATATAALVLVALIGVDLAGVGGVPTGPAAALEPAFSEQPLRTDDATTRALTDGAAPSLSAAPPAPAEAEVQVESGVRPEAAHPGPPAKEAAAPAAEPSQRTGLQWALLAVGVVTAAMALVVTMLTWRATRRPV